MKLVKDKRSNKEYILTVSMNMPIYLTQKEEDDGTEVPHSLICEAVVHALANKEYDIQEESAE